MFEFRNRTAHLATGLIFSRKGSTKDPGWTMLWQPLADPTSRDSAGFGETAGRNSGVCFEVRWTQDEDSRYSERLQLLSKNIDQSIPGAAGKRREGPRGWKWTRQPNVLVLRPRDTHASCSESRDHYFLDGRKWYCFSFLNSPLSMHRFSTIIDLSARQSILIAKNSDWMELIETSTL